MEERNQRPSEGVNWSAITLGILILVIAGMLYGGWEYFADEAKAEDMTSSKIDGTSLGSSADEPIVIEPAATVAVNTTPPNAASDTTAAAPKATPTTTKPEPKPEASKPVETTKVPEGGTTTTHTVDMGETFYGVANRYNMKWETLKALNPSIQDVSRDFKVGSTKLKVRIKAIHTVGPGDVLRVVADKYGISKQLLMQANGRTKDFAKRGEQLVIPYATKE
jgi:LysM repeat protein